MSAGAPTTTGVRPLDSITEDAATALADWLGFGDARSLADTYPSIYRGDGQTHRYGVFDGGRLISHAAARDLQLQTSNGLRQATLIGSVATAPDARGRGLASDIIEHAIQAASLRGSVACMLWSDRWSFYERLGFSPAGLQWEVPRASLPRVTMSKMSAMARPAALADLPQMWSLHREKPLRVERSLGEMACLFSTRRMQTFVLESDQRVLAYACLGKGGDMQGWWHELGGADTEVLRLLTLVGEGAGGTATVLLPGYRREILGRLRHTEPGVCALVRTLRGGLGEFFVDGLDSI